MEICPRRIHARLINSGGPRKGEKVEKVKSVINLFNLIIGHPGKVKSSIGFRNFSHFPVQLFTLIILRRAPRAGKVKILKDFRFPCIWGPKNRKKNSGALRAPV